MAILQVRDIDNNLYNSLKISAKMQNRSVSQEVITIIETYLNSSQKNNKNATLEFLSLEGAWEDRRSADDIIKDIRKNRQQLNRFGKNNGIFD
ncbi:MAG TPA: antitoxin [Treponemataceae bacterium]|jgi:plasmid stability protein|nr:antitoxin [Treponemataceae bacterium]HPM06963.1 antitoxin [Treponemataceae bacterium]